MLNAAISHHEVIGRYLSIESIGILFGPELKTVFLRLPDSFSQNNLLYVKWDGEIEMNLLDDATPRLFTDFKPGVIELAKDYALRIRNAIMDLHKGLEKEELGIGSLKSTFN